MATYLELVNLAILESGIDLDEIEVGDFANPPDPMHAKFKKYVKRAWRDIQQERNEWQFRTAQAQFLISPRFLVVDGDRATAPPVGSQYQGDDTEAEFTVLDITLLSGTWLGGDAEAWIDFKDYSTTPLKWNEYFDELTPDPLNINVFRAKWWGRYDLIGSLTDCLEPDLNTFFIQSTGGSSQQGNTSASDNQIITYTPYSQWLYGPESENTGRGRPTTFTTTPEGYFDFYPRPDQQYVLTFTYSVKPQELEAADDVIEALPSSYTDVILWRAVMYYADYDDKPQVFTRAERHYETYKNRLERNQLPPLSWSPNIYDYCGWY